MVHYLLQGFLLGLAYLAPIGMQNLYVINTAAQGNWRRTVLVALATIFFDISLAVSCFFGVGLLLDAFPALRRGVMLAGSVTIGDYSHVAPGALVRDWREVGEHTTVGLGAVVVKDVMDGETVAGNPARPL